MGMLIRRHRKGVDAVRQVDTPPGGLPTPPIVKGDTGVPDTESTVVPTGEVPAAAIEAPTGDGVVAEGTPGGAENIEDKTGTFEGQTASEVQEEVTEAVEMAIEAEATEAEPEAPTRSGSKKAWVTFYEATKREIAEGSTRDSLAEAVLGSK